MRVIAAMVLVAFSAMVNAEGALPAPESAQVYFITPVNGAVLNSPVRVVMGLVGMGVAPAGVERERTGHHHLIVNAPTPPSGVPIPADDNHRHFGAGQTETRIELPPGSHALQLVVGDHLHRPHAPPIVSDVIRITVE